VSLRSLEHRLVAGFAVLAAVCALATAFAMNEYVEAALWGPIDAGFEEEAEQLAHVVALAPGTLRDTTEQVAAETDHGPGKWIRILLPAADPLTAGGPAPVHATDEPPVGDAVSGTVWLAGQPHRVVRYGLPAGGSIELGVDATEPFRVLRRARIAIVGGLGTLLVAAVLLAWTITRRATAELVRVAAELETIEAGSLDRRLDARRTVEVDRLVAVLNRVLGRLHVAMSHLRRFTAEAAHELRTPVAALRAHLEVTLRRARTTEEWRDGMLDALEQAERLGTLAESLLTLSAVEAQPVPQGAPVELDAVVRDIAESLEPIAQEQGRPFVAQVDESIAVRGSAELLKRVVVNLLDNAFRHTPPAARVELVLRRENGAVRLDVRDAGPGIAPEDRERLFERFHRGRGAAAGAGLGLALCREIVARHGGDIQVESAAGHGTTVSVILPAVY
jgi:signal transduction histidine kinase